MPDLSTVHIDQALTNLSIMYSNPMYVAESVAPCLPVAKRSDKYFIYDTKTALASSGKNTDGKAKSLRRPGAEAVSIDFVLSTDNYYCEEYALRKLVTDAERKYADTPLQPDNDATIALTSRLYLDNETMCAALVGTFANYPAANRATLTTGAAGTSWNSYGSAASVPMKNIQDAKTQVIKSIAREANALFVNHGAGKTLTEHPTYRDEFKYVSREGMTASGLCPIIKGLQVTEGATQADGGDVWVDAANSNPFALIHYRDTDVGPRSVHFARTMECPDDLSGARGVVTRRYRWEPLKGEYIESAMTRDYKVIAVDSNGKNIGGFIYQNVNV